MSLFDNLLIDKDFVAESLLSLIEEERDRIVYSNVMSEIDCDNRLRGFIIDLYKNASNSKDDLVLELTKLYDCMKSVKLAGDTFGKIEEEPDQPKENDKSVVTADTIINLVVDRLDSIVADLGSSGNHKAAYEVEKTIRNIRRS